MNGRTIHLVTRLTGQGGYATSPQAPGLTYGRPTLWDLRAGLDEVLAFHFNRPGPFPVVEHQERAHEVAGRELVTRLALDGRRAARREVYDRLIRALAAPEQARLVVEAPTNAAGEIVYVCAVPSDTVRWLADQLDVRGDAIVVATAIADALVFTLPLVREQGEAGQRLRLGSRAYPVEATVGQIIADIPVVRPVTAERLLTA